MSQIIVTAAGTFGPFSSVEMLEDRYRCDGELDLQFAVIGAATVQDAAGYTPPAPLPVVPKSIAMWQAQAVLAQVGLNTALANYISSITDAGTRAQAHAKLEYSSTMRRDDPLLKAVAPALGLTEARIDALFIQAAALI